MTFVISADGESNLLHQNKLAEDDMCMATPVIVDGQIFVRVAHDEGDDSRVEKLYCLESAVE